MVKLHNIYKRFNVTRVTRDKIYNLTTDHPKQWLHLTSNPNEADIVTIILRQSGSIKIEMDLDFADLSIKGRSVKGNIVSKHTVQKVYLKKRIIHLKLKKFGLMKQYKELMLMVEENYLSLG